MEQKILSLKDDKINSEVELFEYPEELRGRRNLVKNTDLNGLPYRYNHINKAGEGGLRLSTLGFSEPIVQPQQYTISMEIRGASDVQIVIYRISPQGNSSITLIQNTYLTEEYKKVKLTFTPHRPQLTDLFVYTGYMATAYNAWFEIKPNSIKLEKGSTATPWTPAPEDLNLSYPDFITEFKPSISDKYILTEELIEGQPTSFSNKITTNEFIEQ